jgi:hypothetical protein
VTWLLDGLINAAAVAGSAAFAVWMAGAIYYDVGRASRWGQWLAGVWLAGVVVLFILWQPPWQPALALAAVGVLVLVWWFRQKPRHDREWDPAAAVLPRADRQGDEIKFMNVRNFEYRSPIDFDARYESRAVRLSNLRGADVIFFNWGSPWMSHPVLVFDFGPDGRVCFSIEVRYRKGQAYSVVRSLYRQQELFVLAADERDVILRRTKGDKPQAAHLYRMHVPDEVVRAAFLDYVGLINDLYARPQWYHGVSANCTTTFYRLPNTRRWFDWRILANGRLDRALYDAGRLDRSVPFDELRRTAYLTDVANAAPADGFGDYVRRELEARRGR